MPLPNERHIFAPALIACLALITACGEEPQTGGSGGWGGPVSVTTQPVRLQPLVDEIQALGTARANESIEIRPRVASLVTRILFEEGELVQQGDLLLELENSEIVAGLALAEAELSESRSLYNRSKELESTQAISASNLEQLLAQVKMNAIIQADCVRCLTDTDQQLRSEFTELFAFSMRTASESELILPEDGYIDLGPLVREYLVLEIPINPLCQPDCQGICAVCGAFQPHLHEQDTRDPRMAVLGTLLDNQAME